ncbi:MAG: superoxide dismutase, Ni [Nitrosomonadaceae bacterium]|nr:superoxide dismutase, Ni [Nitrosomonadaceae bacterium]|tara:strand:+ start:810 stop:1283 length:474 start_codon:yes stop_codon:yes gene_type:complete
MLTIDTAHAHCDIPCKVYDPAVIQYSALSIIRFMDLIADEIKDSDMNASKISQLARLTAVKEQHAKEVKSEVSTIWGDYFKEPQISKYPEIHELTHSIMQLASKCKQDINRDNGVELLEKVNKFTEIFWETKNIKTEKCYAPYPPELVIVCPVLKSV